MYLMLVHTCLQAWYWKGHLLMCLSHVTHCTLNWNKRRSGSNAARFRLCSLMEAVFQTFAWAKSGLHFAFVIRAWFVLCEKLLGSVKRAKIQKKMKADRNERKKGLKMFMGMLLQCIIYIVSTPRVCSCYYKYRFELLEAPPDYRCSRPFKNGRWDFGLNSSQVLVILENWASFPGRFSVTLPS